MSSFFQLLDKAGEHARRCGFIEIDRYHMMRMLFLHRTDDVIHFCSKLSIDQVFSSICRLYDDSNATELKNHTQANKGWVESTPVIMSNKHATGFGVGVSRRTWIEALTVIRQQELLVEQSPECLDPLPYEGDEDDMTLVSLNPMFLRIFCKDDVNQARTRWMCMMPIVAEATTRSVEEIKMSTMKNNAVLVDGSQFKWLLLPEDEVFVYNKTIDRPLINTGKIVSCTTRCLDRRKMERINAVTLMEANQANARPPIPIIRKQEKNVKKDGSGEHDTTNEEAREDALATKADEVGDETAREGMPRIGNIPAPDARNLDWNVRKRTREIEEDKEWDGETLDNPLHKHDMKLYLKPGEELSAVPPPLPPAYYVEQLTNRLRMCAAVFMIPFGVLMNYSIINGADEGAKSIFANTKATGFGGETTSTTAASWKIFERSMDKEADELQEWSKTVLSAMLYKQTQRKLRATNFNLDGFYTKHGTEEQFEHDNVTHYSSGSDKDENDLNKRRQARTKLKEDFFQQLTKEAQQTMKDNQKIVLVFQIPRERPIEQLRAAYQEQVLTAESYRTSMANYLKKPESEMEPANVMKKTRDLLLKPVESEAAPKKKKK